MHAADAVAGYIVDAVCHTRAARLGAWCLAASYADIDVVVPRMGVSTGTVLFDGISSMPSHA